ncbi:methylmalonyl-CoA mutase family protein [Ekhidna sp.]|uniref:methylmalonyl-CoA mutase family protein n=1 Tax=Ekhidna sp. TaxID=2608089 RepID=UPI0032F02CF5
MKDLNLDIFPATNKEQWKQLAEKQLKGADPDRELTWKNNAEINLEAYYDTSDLDDLKYLQDYFEGIGSHKWKLYEEVEVDDEKNTNKNILKALMGGCDGIILKVNEDVDFESALKNVDRDICDIAIRSSKSFDLRGINGFLSAPEGNCFESPISTNPISQISSILKGLSDKTHIYRTAYSDFFLEISSLRALRFLLNRSDVQIHTNVPKHKSDEHQWFVNTTAGLASILGGTHSIDFSTVTGDSRISRNTGNLIREESGIEEYSDQCGGSYYVEVLTDRIIQEVKEKLK